MKYKLYQVGGSVRDELMGIPTNDIDFTIVVEPTEYHPSVVFNQLKDILQKEQHCRIFFTQTSHYTYRTKTTKDHPKYPNMYVDFTLSVNGDNVGTLEDDLYRRDFTINALAKDPETGEIIDLVGGVSDINNGVIRSVRDVHTMLLNDPIRILRAYRFCTTKNCKLDRHFLLPTIKNFEVGEFKKVELTRLRDELEKWFKANSIGAMMQMIYHLSMDNPEIFNYIFEQIWFRPNIKKVK
jgi:tRNA nucleotidyltransferase/poly(A) polymerase